MTRGKRRSTKTMSRSAKNRYTGRLADKKINTLVEKRCVEIAKKEATKARAKTYLDNELGGYYNSGLPKGAVAVTHKLVDCLCSMHVAPLYDEDTHDGNIIGLRHGDDVWFRGFKVSGRLEMKLGTDAAKTKVRLCIFSARRETAPQVSQIIDELPSPIVFNNLSGARMDEEEKVETSKVTLLASKVVTLSPITVDLPVYKDFSISHYFKRPQWNQYAADDRAGANPLKRSYWFGAFADRDSHDTGAQAKVGLNCTSRAFVFVE